MQHIRTAMQSDSPASLRTVDTYALFGLSSNRAVTQLEVDNCRRLVRKIFAVARASDLGHEKAWQAPDLRSVHGGICSIDWNNVDAKLLNELRIRSHVFSGWYLSTLLSDDPQKCWTDELERHFIEQNDTTPWPIVAFRRYASNLPEEYVFRPPLVCGEAGYNVDGYCVNPDVVAYQERALALYRSGVLERLKLLEHPTIVEIGAGYGALAHFIKSIVPQARYIIVDIPSSLMFSSCYLSISQNDHPVTIFDPEDLPSLDKDYLFVLPSAIDSLSGLSIDLAVNTLSFQEMPAETVSNYASFISRYLAPFGALFEQNYDNTHFKVETFCNPEGAIKPHFKHQQRLVGQYLWGIPTLWFNDEILSKPSGP